MKKMSFVIAILTAALLAGACGKKKDAAAPMTPPAEGSAAPAEPPAAGSAAEPGAGSGSAQ